jgi:hypothetical protein
MNKTSQTILNESYLSTKAKDALLDHMSSTELKPTHALK